jgi:hypothetical protein
MKFLSITLITALFVIGAVLVGVPAYKAMATTDSCLYLVSPDDDPVAAGPCGFIFKVRHMGIGTRDEANCQCAHQPQWVKLVIDGGPSGEMSYYDSVPCTTQDGSIWCAVIHFHSGTYYYHFECSDGEELGVATPIVITNVNCSEQTHVEPCQ